ncbi:VOC family protein [Calidifontibacter terrae]
MTIHTGPWPTGTPCWIDCAYEEKHRGIHHAKDFYSHLFGWRITGDDDSYLLCLKDEQPIAGIVPTQTESPTFWNVHLATDNLDDMLQRAIAAGATVTDPAAAVGSSGRGAQIVDPTGATVSLWEAGDHAGYGLTEESDTPAWHSLLTHDVAAAQQFYGEVFGLTFTDEDEFGATACLADGTQVFNIHRADQLPDDVQATWLVHFEVADRGASAQMAQELDGFLLMTFDSPTGPAAIVQAKHGEIFGLLQRD